MLSVVTTVIWLFFTLCFSDEAIKARPGSQERTDERNQEAGEDLNNTAIQTNVNKLSKQKGFIKSILYNQVPLTAFMNRRALLASSTIWMGFSVVTFPMPFFSLISDRPGYQVSLQVTGALLAFVIATLVSVHVMKLVGAKVITWFALALSMTACGILS